MIDSRWNKEKLQEFLRTNLVEEVMKTVIHEDKEDFAIWMPSNNGIFTSKSAWRKLRKKKGITLTANMIWHPKVPFKVTFFMSRMISRKLPTDDAIQKFNINGPSRCTCYTRGHTEVSEYLFRKGDIEDEVWKYFSGICGISTQGKDTRGTLISWYHKTKNKVHSFFLQCLPSIICWEIWKCRCSMRYEGSKINIRSIISQVVFLSRILIKAQFPSLDLDKEWLVASEQIEDLKSRIVIQTLQWQKPEAFCFKLNTDRCSKENPGSSGGGGILRNDKGELLVAFAAYFGNCSNIEAKAKAIQIGL
ncbi:hypothetical protein RND71_027806 [Anisodus tanguticus]|uniref:Reverse transcriptase zinc-binding domain-containing protein n=1 Tax=Anisodus tanguticus TaxID=243964 RepID=A0AAE1RIK0_9SOLA|nr:hypothetical protein RND71_027806 [Anisodus tanguticus]